jgi:antitoxin MazE
VITSPEGAVVRARVVRIGNSRGIRLPRPRIVVAGLTDVVELEVREGGLFVAPVAGARAGWAAAAEALAARGGDRVEGGAVPTRFDRRAWKW